MRERGDGGGELFGKGSAARQAEETRPCTADAESFAAQRLGNAADIITARDEREAVGLVQLIRQAYRDHLLIAEGNGVRQHGEMREIKDCVGKGNACGQGAAGLMGAEGIIRGEDDEMQRLMHRIMGGIDLSVARGGGDKAAEERRGEVVRVPLDGGDDGEKLGL